MPVRPTRSRARLARNRNLALLLAMVLPLLVMAILPAPARWGLEGWFMGHATPILWAGLPLVTALIMLVFLVFRRGWWMPVDAVVGRMFVHAQDVSWETEGSRFPMQSGARRELAFEDDAGAQERSSDELRKMRDFYLLLSEINQAIVRKKNRAELFSEVCRVAVDRAHVRFAAILMLEEGRDTLRVEEKYGDDAGYLDHWSASSSADEPTGIGPIGTAVRSDRPVVCNDFEHDPATAAWRQAARRIGLRAVAAYPLSLNGGVIGVMYLCSGEKGFFMPDITSTLEQVAQDVSFALDYYEREQRRRVAERELLIHSTMLKTQQETALDGILLIDPEMRITSYNTRFTELWHAPPEVLADIDGQRLLDWANDQVKDKERFLARIRELYADREATGHDELELKDGRTIARYSAPMLGDDGSYHGRVWYHRDITERKQAQKALAESEARYRRLVEQDLIGIYIIQDGRFMYANPHLEKMLGYDVGAMAGMDIECVIDEPDRALVRENIRKRVAHEVETLQYSFRALRKDGSVFTAGVQGSISLFGGQPVIFGLLQDVTEQLHAEEMTRRHVAEIESAMLGTIDAVSKMVEIRDPYTAGHERRVSEIASAIAFEMGMHEERIRVIRMAALLHDIGKISCPAEILVKPTRLTPAEYEIIKSHPALGYDILKSVRFPWPIADIVLQHHERFDGSGYPHGLKGDGILVEARIVAVADTVESMMSHRPYRPAHGIDKALDEITVNRGRLYDPKVVDACLSLFRDKGYQVPA